MRVMQLMRGSENHCITKKEGRPYQNWNCNTKSCYGRVSIGYAEGRNKPGRVITSIQCSCKLVNRALLTAPNLEMEPQLVRRNIARTICLRFGVPIIDTRATSPEGFLGNKPGPLLWAPAEIGHRSKRLKTSSANGTSSACFNFYGKIASGEWFVVGIDCIVFEGTEDERPTYSSLEIPDPMLVATKPLPVPEVGTMMDITEAPNVGSHVDTETDDVEVQVVGVRQADVGKSSNKGNDLEVKPAANPMEEEDLCMICKSNKATVLLPCKALKCGGSKLCQICFSHSTMMRKEPMTDRTKEIYRLNEEKYLSCLNNCRYSRITTFIALDTDDDAEISILFPYSHSYDRPMLDRSEHEKSFEMFEQLVSRPHKNRRPKAEQLAYEETRLCELTKEMRGLQDLGVPVDDMIQAIAECESKRDGLQDYLDTKQQIPAFAYDWKMTQPFPPSSTWKKQRRIPFERRPIGKNFEGWWHNCIKGGTSYQTYARSLVNEPNDTILITTDSDNDSEDNASGNDGEADPEYLPSESIESESFEE